MGQVKNLRKKIKLLILFLFLNIMILGAEKNINSQDLGKIIYKNEINAVDMTLSDFVFYLSKEGNIDIGAEESISGKKIELYMSAGSSLEKILMMLCETHEWKTEQREGYIFISPRAVNKEGRGDITGKIFSSEYKKALSGAKITLLDNYSKPCFSGKEGSFRFENIPYGAYFIRAEKEGYMIEGEFINVDKHNNTTVIFLEKDKEFSDKNKNFDGEDYKEKNSARDFIIEKIKFSDVETFSPENIFDETLREGVKFSANSKKGIIYISGKRDKVYEIKKSLENLDSHNKQVRITAQILDVTDNLFEDLGFNWLYTNNGETKKNNSISGGILSNSSVTGISSLYSSVFSLVRNFNGDEDLLEMSFSLLQGTQDLTISAIPSIVTTNGKEGSFRITEERIIGQEKVENDENSKTTYTPIFKEAGIILNVVPEILKDGYVVLNISLETSHFKMQNYIEEEDEEGNEYNGMGGSKVSRNLETTVRMKDGDTVFIGGLKKGIIQNSESSIPFVSSVPVMGALFRNSSKRREATDLYIRLKVDIVKDGGFSDTGMDTFYGVE